MIFEFFELLVPSTQEIRAWGGWDGAIPPTPPSLRHIHLLLPPSMPAYGKSKVGHSYKTYSLGGLPPHTEKVLIGQTVSISSAPPGVACWLSALALCPLSLASSPTMAHEIKGKRLSH